MIAELIQAQAANDRFAESTAIVALVQRDNPLPRRGGTAAVPIMSRFFEKIVFGSSNCWYWRGSLNAGGYGCIAALGESKAHRVAWRLFRGDIPAGLDVLHTCDVRNCVNPDHLFVGTHADNMKDMASKGRGRTRPRRGIDNPASKLTPEIVAEMKALHDAGLSYAKIAARFGVVPMTAQRAVVGTSWQ